MNLVKRLDTSDDYYQPIWGTMVVHPDPQIIPPGEYRQASVVIDPEMAGINSGQAEFSLTGFINRRMIGGVNFIIEHAGD